MNLEESEQIAPPCQSKYLSVKIFETRLEFPQNTFFGITVDIKVLESVVLAITLSTNR